MNNKLGIIITFSYTTNQPTITTNKTKKDDSQEWQFYIFTTIYNFKKYNKQKNVHLIV